MKKRDLFEVRSAFWIYKIFVTLYTLDKQVIYTCKREETTESIKQIVKGICEAAGIMYGVSVIKEPFFKEDLENGERSVDD